MLWQRLITGPLLIAALLGLVWLDAHAEQFVVAQGFPPGVVLLALCVLLSILIARELAGFMKAAALPVSSGAMCLAAVLGLLATAAGPQFGSTVGVSGAIASALALAFLIALLRMATHRDPKGSLVLVGGTLLATVYGGVLLGFWMLVRLEHSPWVLVGAILTTKSCDIGAYFTGLSIGRHKMIPWLSPKKSWEGLAGGVVTATAVGAYLAHLSMSHADGIDRIPVWAGAVGGALVALIGQAGDLAESAFKRDAGIKDSGRLLPGMGGVLDVLDSPLFAGPVVYWLLRFATAG